MRSYQNIFKLAQLNLLYGIICFALLAITSCIKPQKGSVEMEKQVNQSDVVISPPLKPGQKLDPDSEYARYWTGLPEWVIFDGITFKIPAQFTAFWAFHNYPKINFTIAQEQPAKIRKIDSLIFSMFMPDFGGYTPDNYIPTTLMDEKIYNAKYFNEDEIKIINIQPRPMSYAEPDAAGSYPPNMIKRALEGYALNQYEEKAGLKCYNYKGNGPNSATNRQVCYGLRDAKLDEYILLDVDIPPYQPWVKYPMVRTTYFTKQYGGLEITWWSHAKYFNRWHDIDHQIWQYIDEWNVSKQKQASQSLTNISEQKH